MIKKERKLLFFKERRKKTSIPKGNPISNGNMGSSASWNKTGQPLISLESSLRQSAKKSSCVDTLSVPARLFGFTSEPVAGGAGGMGWRIDDWFHRTDSVRGQHLPSCGQRQTGPAWEVAQPTKGMNILKISFTKGNKIGKLSQNTCSKILWTCYKRNLYFFNGVLY